MWYLFIVLTVSPGKAQAGAEPSKSRILTIDDFFERPTWGELKFQIFPNLDAPGPRYWPKTENLKFWFIYLSTT